MKGCAGSFQILGLALILCFSFSAYANYNSILIGDQAAGMGGAATAMTEDASAVAWYNPAAAAKLEGQSFSAAVGIYKKYDIRYRDDGDFSKASLRVNQGFFRALPSSTGSVIRAPNSDLLRDWTFVFSILVPEYETFKGDIAKEGDSLSTFAMTTESIWVGGGVARRIGASDSVGVTIYYTARSLSKSVNDRTYVNATQSQIFTEERNMTQNAVVMLLGYHRDLSENWKWGLSARLPSLSVAGEAELTRTSIVNGAIQTPVSERALPAPARNPWKISSGVAYTVKGNWSAAFDLNTYGPLRYGDIENTSYAERIEHQPIWNASFGFEKIWAEWFRTRVGIFTNFSPHPNPKTAEVQGQGDHVDQGGFSANLALKSGNIEYTFGGYYTGGRGRSVQRINQNYEVVPKVVNVFTMLVGTSYSF